MWKKDSKILKLNEKIYFDELTCYYITKKV